MQLPEKQGSFWKNWLSSLSEDELAGAESQIGMIYLFISVKTRDYYITLSFMLIEQISEQSVLEYGVEAIGPDFQCK